MMRPRRIRSLGIRGLLLVSLLLTPLPLLADYEDPWGLPSGSAVLDLATQAEINGEIVVQGFDFAAGAAIDYDNYRDLVQTGSADLIYFEFQEDEAQHYLRAPEDLLFFDRELIYSLADSLELAEITSISDSAGVEVSWERFFPVEVGFAYLLLQIQGTTPPETTAVKLQVTAIDDGSLSFDWTWQPNGSDYFVPTPIRESSLSAIKSLYRD